MLPDICLWGWLHLIPALAEERRQLQVSGGIPALRQAHAEIERPKKGIGPHKNAAGDGGIIEAEVVAPDLAHFQRHASVVGATQAGAQVAQLAIVNELGQPRVVVEQAAATRSREVEKT